MFHPRCAFCSHENPPASNYCTACGARLRVIACESCNAMNDADADACYQCAAPLPQQNIALDPAALATAGTRADTALSASARDDVDRARPPLPEPSGTRLRSDSTHSEAFDDAGHEWAGSVTAALAGSSQRPVAPRDSFAKHVGPIVITLAVAILAGVAFYAYRNSADDTPQSAWVGVVNRGGDRTGAANDAGPSAGGKQDNTAVRRDPGAACTEAVAALGLCLPQSIQRRD